MQEFSSLSARVEVTDSIAIRTETHAHVDGVYSGIKPKSPNLNKMELEL